MNSYNKMKDETPISNIKLMNQKSPHETKESTKLPSINQLRSTTLYSHNIKEQSR